MQASEPERRSDIIEADGDELALVGNLGDLIVHKAALRGVDRPADEHACRGVQRFFNF